MATPPISSPHVGQWQPDQFVQAVLEETLSSRRLPPPLRQPLTEMKLQIDKAVEKLPTFAPDRFGIVSFENEKSMGKLALWEYLPEDISSDPTHTIIQHRQNVVNETLKWAFQLQKHCSKG